MILLMGIAGSGKGTQGKMLADKFKLHLLSMGDVLRMYLTGDKREQILSGHLLGDKETIQIVDKILATLPQNEQILFDGFPRTIKQAEWLIEQSKKGRFELEFVIHLNASKAAVKERLLKRARLDDNEDAIEERFIQYEQSTIPLIEWLKKNGIPVMNIKAEQDVKAVNSDLIQVFNKFGINK